MEKFKGEKRDGGCVCVCGACSIYGIVSLVLYDELRLPQFEVHLYGCTKNAFEIVHSI